MKTQALLITLIAVFYIKESLGGFCYQKYRKSNGCRRLDRSKGKQVSFEDCCKNGGFGGWAAKKRHRKTACRPCTTFTLVTSHWADWSVWTPCSATCGTSYRTRSRKCISDGQPRCVGRSQQREKCSKKPCAVNGGWTEWTKWSACSVTCGAGHRMQRRSCSNPKPQHGGKECKGSMEKWSNCKLQEHCPIDGDWGTWGAWGGCSVTCNLGTKRRTRKCDNPKPKYGGKPCNPAEATGIQYCREERCGTTSVGCLDDDDCASGSGSGWTSKTSGSGSGDSSSRSGSGSGEGSGGAGSGSRSFARSGKINIPDDED